MFNVVNPDIPKHKVFISFHHADEYYRKQFETNFSEIAETFICRSVQDGDIDPTNQTDTTRRIIRDRFISNSTVTIVLIGAETWKRKHVDWEIGYSLTSTNQNTRSGLIGILLPSYFPSSHCYHNYECTDNAKSYTPCNIPPRLFDNIESGYAKIYSYPSSPLQLKKWIHEAYQRRSYSNHKNSRPYFANNRSTEQIHWE